MHASTPAALTAIALTGFTGFLQQAVADTIIVNGNITNDFLSAPLAPASLSNYYLPAVGTQVNYFTYGGAVLFSDSQVISFNNSVLFGNFEATNILPSYNDSTLVNNQVGGIAKTFFGSRLQTPGGDQYLPFKWNYGSTPEVGSLGFNGDGSLGLVSYTLPSAAPEPDDWALLVAGIGAAGAAIRAARRRARLAAA